MPPSTIPDLLHALLREHPRVHRALLRGGIALLHQVERLSDVAVSATWARTGLQLELDAADHRFLCHADGGACPDGCDAAADPERLREYRDEWREHRRPWKPPAWMRAPMVPWTDDDEAHVIRLKRALVDRLPFRKGAL